MRLAWRGGINSSIRTRGRDRKGYSKSQTLLGLLIAVFSLGLFSIVWIYGNGLRDARYLDGWVLAVGVSLQLCFHIAIKVAKMSPKSAMRWRKVHIVLGYLLIAAFLSHSDFSLPETGFEFALWASFVLVTFSGIFGTYLAWSLQGKSGIDERLTYDRIPTRRAELARDLDAAVAKIDPAAGLLALPTPPHDAWIMELYSTELKKFFQGQRNVTAHLVGSQRALTRLTHDIDQLSTYVDQPESAETCRDQEAGH